MIISIASGKGGTGKTTIATNLAMSVEAPVQLLDCDVEAPNAHLFIKPEITEIQKVYVPIPVVDEAKCNLCGKCAQICRFKAIIVLGETVLTFPEMCHSCGGCIAVCPEGALSETGRELGVIEKGHKGHLDFAYGRLNIGEAMAPPLIRKVRECYKHGGLTIIDAPPGTSCPVITAIKQTDFVVMVTEPTPFGLHDLKLAVEAVRMLKIPFGIVINRSDIGNEGVASFAARENISVLMEIPYERQIAEAYSRGQLQVDAMPHWRRSFQDLLANIKIQIANHKACQ